MDPEEIRKKLVALMNNAADTGDVEPYHAEYKRLERSYPLQVWTAARMDAGNSLVLARARLAKIPPFARPYAHHLIDHCSEISLRARVNDGAGFNGLFSAAQELAIEEHGFLKGVRKGSYASFARPDMSTANEVIHEALDMLTLYAHRLAYLRCLYDLVHRRKGTIRRYRQQSILTLERALARNPDAMPPELLLGEDYYHLRNAAAHSGVRFLRSTREIVLTDINPKENTEWKRRMVTVHPLAKPLTERLGGPDPASAPITASTSPSPRFLHVSLTLISTE